MLKLQYPTKVGDYLGCLDVTSIADTVWHDVKSQDFKDSTTGTAIPSDLPFSEITVYNASNNSAFFKLRPRVGAGDTTANELILLAGGVLSFQALGLSVGELSTVAFKKGNGADQIVFTCSFVKKGV